MSKKTVKTDSALVTSNLGFNIVGEDGLEKRYNAGQEFELSELTKQQISNLKELGVEFTKVPRKRFRA